MSERIQRHSILLDLVHDRVVESQAELLDALSGAGLEVHQSTLSRDLRELGIRKVRGRYRAPQASAGSSTSPRPSPAARATGEGDAGASPDRPLPVVHGFTACGPNLITVRAGTGQAQLLGVLLDDSANRCITGTIAGDDTVLVITKGRPQQREALGLLTDWFGREKHDAL